MIILFNKKEVNLKMESVPGNNQNLIVFRFKKNEWIEK